MAGVAPSVYDLEPEKKEKIKESFREKFLSTKPKKETHKFAAIRADLRSAASRVDTSPTEAAIAAGNYRKGHVRMHGLHVAIENPKGSTRSGTDSSGKSWSVTLSNHYGYIKGTEGKDRDPVDVFIGPDPESELVTVINQVDPKSGEFDEHKVMMGFINEEDAKKAYYANYEKGWKGLGSAHTMSVQDFRKWLEDRSQKRPITKTAKEKASKTPLVAGVAAGAAGVGGYLWNRRKKSQETDENKRMVNMLGPFDERKNGNP